MQIKEHLLYFFLNKPLRLHYSDKKFFNNLTNIINNNNTITTGQALLFDKLIEKYETQLKQTNLSINQMVSLPWQAQVMETSKEHTSARLTLVNGILEIKVPMNNKFIRKFDDINDNPFIWEKNKKAYVAPFNTHSLKVAHSVLPKYFSQVVYCNQIKEIIDSVSHLSDSSLIWEPTLVNINNYYYVVAINEPLSTHIKNIELNNKPDTLFKLSKLGIKVHDNIIDNDLQKFAAEFITDVDINQASASLVKWLVDLEVKQVLLGMGMNPAFNKQLFLSLIENLQNSGIEWIRVNSNFTITSTIKQPVLLQYHGNENMKFSGSGSVAKCVFIKNSNPIEVK
jgi:hypothetical protein